MKSTSFKKRVKVLICDDNHEHVQGISELIKIEGDFDVVATTTSAATALILAKKYRPDVILMDMNMPEKDGLSAIYDIEKAGLETGIVALSAYDDSDLIFRAMKTGAKAYILKTMASAQLIKAIEEVSQGRTYLPQSLSCKFFNYFQALVKKQESETKDETNLLNTLTQREEEVLDLLTQGLTYKDVAKTLFIADTTVKTHVNNIFQKLQVSDRTGAVLYAINNGFMSKKRAQIAV
ncbi:response regulator transcription factor [bacterium]|nr:response regulator transcription factor [bacterium]